MTALAIREDEAEIVRLIFNLYVHGDEERANYSLHRLVEKLTRLGVPVATESNPVRAKGRVKSGKWTIGSVHWILKREFYATGEYTYGKHDIIIDVPTIITKELFDASREQAKRNGRFSKRNTKHNYLMRGRFTCSRCGKVIGCRADKGKYFYYRCHGHSTYDDHGNLTCDLPYFNAVKTDKIVWQWLKSLFQKPEALAQALEDRRRERETELRPYRDRLQAIDRLIEENQAKKKRLMKLYLSEVYSLEDIQELKAEIENVLTSLQSEKEKIMQSIDTAELTNSQIDDVVSLASAVRQGIQKAERLEDFELMRKLVDTLDVEGELLTIDGERFIDITCVVSNERLEFASTHLKMHA